MRLLPRAGIKLRRQVDRVRPRPCKIYFYFVLIFELTLDMSPLQDGGDAGAVALLMSVSSRSQHERWSRGNDIRGAKLVVNDPLLNTDRKG